MTEAFRQHAITYIPSERTKSQIYNECLPLLNARKVELLDNRKLGLQLASLERRTIRGGSRGDSVDHPPGCVIIDQRSSRRTSMGAARAAPWIFGYA